MLVAYLLRTRLREPHGGHARRAGRRARGADRPPAHDLPLEAAARLRRRAGASASRRSPRSRFAPRTSRRSTKASRPRAARSSSSSCTFSKGTIRRVHVQLQSRPVRQARSVRAPGAVRRAARDVVDVLQVAVDARRARRPRRSCRRCSPRRSSCSDCFGGWVHFQRDRRSFWYFGSLMFTMTLVLIYYLNFKLGASQDPRSRKRRTRFATETTSSSGASRRGACGRRSASLFVWESIASLIGTRDGEGRTRDDRRCRRRRALEVDARRCSLLAIVPLFANWHWASRAGQTRHAPTSRPTCSTPSSRTACSSPSATTTPSRSGTRRKSKASGSDVDRREHVAAQHRLVRAPDHSSPGRTTTTRRRVRRSIAASTWTKPTSSPIHMTMTDADSVPAYYPLTRADELQRRAQHPRDDRSAESRPRRAAARRSVRAAHDSGRRGRSVRSTSRARRAATRARSASATTC